VLEVAFAVPNFAGQIAFLRVLAPNFDEPAQAKKLSFRNLPCLSNRLRGRLVSLGRKAISGRSGTFVLTSR